MKFHPFYFISILILCSTMLMAGNESYISSLKGDDIETSASLLMEDGWHGYMSTYSDWSNVDPLASKSTAFSVNERFVNLSIDGYLSLRWEGSEDVAFSNNWYYKLEVLVGNSIKLLLASL